MKQAIVVFVSLFAAASSSSPVTQVVSLLTELEAKVQADGRGEQQSYDKYACWVENTLGRKANDISTSKETIEDLQTKINKLKGELGSHGADIAQLKKDIAANIAAQREAEEVRASENEAYDHEKTESEQCIGALEAAIKVLTGAGTAKKGFLETFQEAQLLGVVAGMRDVLKQPVAAQAVSESDLHVIKRFVESPEDFVGGHVGVMSATQISNNPFGDYAPQSTQIQGILKGMYEAFAQDLEKANAEEADAQKSHQELMATKKQELNTLQSTLEKQTLDHARKTADLADSKQLRDDTIAQLAADEDFFEETKQAGKFKAGEWAERTRLRTEELQGITKAIEILSSPDALRTFNNASTTLVQVSSHSSNAGARAKVYAQLRSLAGRYHSISLGRVAVELKNGGYFDKVIASIDTMIKTLRKEEQEDIAHRDRCEAAEGKNKNDKEDLEHNKQKAINALSRMGDEDTAIDDKITALKAALTKTETDMDQMLSMRNQEHADFVQALKDDTDAVALLEMAIESLTKFYKKNRLAVPAFAQEDPEYTVDQDKAPETTWSGKNYGGRSSESGGLIAIISMIKEDLEREIKVAREEDGEAQAEYARGRSKLQATHDSQTQLKIANEKDLATLRGDIVKKEQYKSAQEADIDAENTLAGAITNDCSWVASHFDTRRQKRKVEINGLVEAKDYLAGVESGDDLTMN